MDERFAVVEQMGHRKFGARIREHEEFGQKFLRAEILVANGDAPVQIVHPQSVYAITACTEAQARAVNANTWSLRQAVPLLDSPASSDGPGDIAVTSGGSEVCPRRCSECAYGEHHFSTAMLSSADDEPDHAAAQAGHQFWYPCKHCDAWRTELDEANDEFAEIETHETTTWWAVFNAEGDAPIPQVFGGTREECRENFIASMMRGDELTREEAEARADNRGAGDFVYARVALRLAWRNNVDHAETEPKTEWLDVESDGGL